MPVAKLPVLESVDEMQAEVTDRIARMMNGGYAHKAKSTVTLRIHKSGYSLTMQPLLYPRAVAATHRNPFSTEQNHDRLTIRLGANLLYVLRVHNEGSMHAQKHSGIESPL
jgi:hypothetical protein